MCAQTTRNIGFFNKADVLVLVDNNVEWVSVKKFTASFNQIDKRRVDEFAKLWHMPDYIRDIAHVLWREMIQTRQWFRKKPEIVVDL